MTEVVQQIVTGIMTGSIYALVGIGLVVIAQATEIINFGQAAMATFASFVAYSLMLRLPYPLAFVLAIAASMAELASAYPTAGGLYYWASKMKNKNWGWWTAWFNLIGQIAITAGIDYGAAVFTDALLQLLWPSTFHGTQHEIVAVPLPGRRYENDAVDAQLVHFPQQRLFRNRNESMWRQRF